MYTMGDVAQMSLRNEEVLYKIFGVNAELLIDHAWGYESCGMQDIKSYRPTCKSLSSGQVLSHPYRFDRARIILSEMCYQLVLDMVAGKVAAGGIVLDVSYDAESLRGNDGYSGEVGIDYYGRLAPKHSHGSVSFGHHTSSTEEIMRCARELFDRTVDRTLLVRRINITAVNLIAEGERERARGALQIDIFTDAAKLEKDEKERENLYLREKRRQNAIISLKNRFGKNALVLGMSFEEGATMIDRNLQIGGHKA
jgi:DNA polymerase V